jgi:integral membrane protein (TIGR01906 family)
LLGGGAITVALLLVTLLVVVFAFGPFFVFFHRIFFEGDTWLFNWYDTLIRLFPVKFWQDVFLWVGGGAILEAAVIGALAWWGLKVRG